MSRHLSRLAGGRLPVLAGLLLACTFAAALWAVKPAAAQPLSPPAQNAQCLRCHGTQAHTSTPVNGALAGVDKAAYDASLHGGLDCTSCHLGFKADKHTAAETSNWRETAALNACADCHASEFTMYQGSFHGQLVLSVDSSRAPRCADCHEPHNIVDVKSLAFRRSSLTTCSRCHGGRAATYLDGYHGKAFLLGRTAAAVCIDCHGGHQIFAPSDPASRVGKQHLLATCRTCHPTATANFTGYRIHVDASNPHSSLPVFIVWIGYIALISVVFTFAGVHSALYIYRGIKSGGYRRRHA
jgi:hypothetical protein